MIGKISGKVEYRSDDHVLIDTGGVGYIVYCSERTLNALPAEGQHAALYTELVVREDLMQLYGFITVVEREWHRLLTSVQGIGAKAALAIQGTLGPEAIARAIALGDIAAIKAAPGIGPKIAARVANELKDKAPALMAMGAGGARAAMVSARPSSDPDPVTALVDDVPNPSSGTLSASAQADALSALANLGYTGAEAANAVAHAAQDADIADDAGGLIRAALKHLAPKG